MWKTSSFCNADSPMCVEVQHLPAGGVLLRDTEGDLVQYDADEWAAFIAGVKAGEFDAP